MPDYLFQTRVTVDVDLVPRGTGGALIGQNNSNIPGVGLNDTEGPPGFAQTMRLQKRELVGNAITTPPTQAQIIAAITQAANDLATQLTPAVVTRIGNWATGSE